VVEGGSGATEERGGWVPRAHSGVMARKGGRLSALADLGRLRKSKAHRDEAG